MNDQIISERHFIFKPVLAVTIAFYLAMFKLGSVMFPHAQMHWPLRVTGKKD